MRALAKGRRTRVIALLAAFALVFVGCGARLSEEERAEAIAALTGGGSGVGTTNGGTTGDTTGETGGDTSGGTDTGGGGDTGGGDDTGGGGTAVGSSGGATCAKATKETDTGATASKLTVATLADISGVQPGLFQSAHQGARAATAYINGQGGICGRQIDLKALDSKTDAGGNRAAMLDACSTAFAVVGSVSAFDDGSAAPGQACGIPDISAVVTNAPKYNASNTFPVNAAAAPRIGTTSAKYISQRYPDVIKNAGIIWLNQAVTKNNAAARERAWKTVGFNFKYRQEVQVLEANYTRFVIDMQNNKIQYITMVSDFQNIQRLQKSMRQQNYVPKVRDWDSVAYDPDYLKEAAAVEGSFVFLNTALIEEGGTEMNLYKSWLQRGSPGAVPDYFGLYAWSAFRLFQKLAIQIGPDLTREKMLSALKATKEWNGNGLHGPHQTGAKLPTVCNVYAQVKGGKFARLAPASGFDCSGGLA